MCIVNQSTLAIGSLIPVCYEIVSVLKRMVEFTNSYSILSRHGGS